MKQLKIWGGSIGALLILVCVIFLFVNQGTFKISDNRKSNTTIKWPADGLYFIKWNSYQGYSTEEEPYIQLSFIQVHAGMASSTLPTYKRYAILSNIGEIPATFIRNNMNGSQEKDYSLCTLELLLPKKGKGKYILNKVKLVDQNNREEVHDIGNWVIDVRDDIEDNDIKLGKTTFVSGELDWYRAELTNTTQNQVNINGLQFELSNYSLSTTITTSSDFNMSSDINNKSIVKPQETRTCQFEFKPGKVDKNLSKFISIRPFLSYTVNNKQKAIILPTAIYSPPVNDNEILRLVRDAS